MEYGRRRRGRPIAISIYYKYQIGEVNIPTDEHGLRIGIHRICPGEADDVTGIGKVEERMGRFPAPRIVDVREQLA